MSVCFLVFAKLQRILKYDSFLLKESFKFTRTIFSRKQTSHISNIIASQKLRFTQDYQAHVAANRGIKRQIAVMQKQRYGRHA